MRLAIVTMLLVMVLLACGENLSVEQEIRTQLQNMEESAEAGEHFKFMGYVADSFSAQQGTMDRRGFHRFMIFQINQHRRLHAQFFPIYVHELAEGRASADFRLLVTGGGGLLPESGQIFEVKTQWLLEGGDWLLEKADWETAELPELPSRYN